MISTPMRSYSCKDEELTAIAGFVLFSFGRDSSDFSAYSPVFDSGYNARFQSKIEAARELVQPRLETIELKTVTDGIYKALDQLNVKVGFIEGYLQLASQIPISATDFGILPFRKSVRYHDLESVFTHIRTIEANIQRYKDLLMDAGLKQPVIDEFNATLEHLIIQRNRRYQLISERNLRVQSNLGLLNDLYNDISTICKIGKIIYKIAAPAKIKEYTFAQLMKQVRRTEKPAEEKPAQPTPTE